LPLAASANRKLEACATWNATRIGSQMLTGNVLPATCPRVGARATTHPEKDGTMRHTNLVWMAILIVAAGRNMAAAAPVMKPTICWPEGASS